MKNAEKEYLIVNHGPSLISGTARFFCLRGKVVKAYLKPFIPWVGGKRAMLPVLYQLFPNDFHRLVEVFGGGAAVIFGRNRAAVRRSTTTTTATWSPCSGASKTGRWR